MSDSAFVEVLKSAGGVFAQSGAAGAVEFGHPRAEYTAAVNDAAVFDFSDRTHIELTGTDRASFLHNFCTNEVRGLQPGQGCEAFVTNVKGRVLEHIFAFVGEDSIWLESVAGCEDALLAHLNRYLITEDVELHGRSSQYGELFVTGPQAAAFSGKVPTLDVTTESLEPYGHASVCRDGVWVSVRRVDLIGQPGYLLLEPRDRLADLWLQLTDAGIRPAGSAAFDALRIEAGMPLYGVDISDEQLAHEVARTRQAISFKKGCYLGQEPISRIDAMGHVNRELRGLRLASGPVPQRGSPVFGDAATKIGTVTSAALSYHDDLPVALAYLQTSHVSPGTTVSVRVNGVAVPATVYWPHS